MNKEEETLSLFNEFCKNFSIDSKWSFAKNSLPIPNLLVIGLVLKPEPKAFMVYRKNKQWISRDTKDVIEIDLWQEIPEINQK